MPSVRETLTTQVLALLEGDADVTTYFNRAGNRGVQNSTTWLRDELARAPADFRRFTIDFARFRHSMWTLAESGFAADSPTFKELAAVGVNFRVEKVFDLTITLREELPKSGVVSAPEEAIIGALFKAGTRLGLPLIVQEVGTATAERRETRRDEKPARGTVTTIRLPITTFENGPDLL